MAVTAAILLQNTIVCCLKVFVLCYIVQWALDNVVDIIKKRLIVLDPMDFGKSVRCRGCRCLPELLQVLGKLLIFCRLILRRLFAGMKRFVAILKTRSEWLRD
jgi:hypothetical protein